MNKQRGREPSKIIRLNENGYKQSRNKSKQSLRPMTVNKQSYSGTMSTKMDTLINLKLNNFPIANSSKSPMERYKYSLVYTNLKNQ